MRLFLAALSAALLIGPAAAQTVVVPAPGVPGGQVKLVPRDQLRAGPGVKTARLPHALRAQLDKQSLVVPPKWDWSTTESGLVKLPMYGNDQYGDCYYVTLVKMFVLYQWQVQKSQLTFDTNALVSRYKQLSGGDNGLSDSDVFPEIKKGVIGPNGPHKALDVMVVPSSDKAALSLTGWAFGPQMFTFTVYTNFTNGAKPGAVFTGSSGRNVGGHAVPFSGRKANGNWQLETWGMQPCVEVTDSWVHSVDPEFIAVFSNEWFDAKGYAPNGMHYNELAPLWNSLGGSVPVPGPFPPPQPVTGPTIASFAAAPASVPAGQPSTLTWATANATAVTLNGSPVPAAGTQTVTPALTTAYTLTATGAAGTSPATATATVTVGSTPPPPGPGPFTGSIYYQNGVIVGFGPLPGPAPKGSDAVLADAFVAGKASPAVILADLINLYAAYQTKDPAAIAAAVAQLLADLKGTPAAAPHSFAPVPTVAPQAMPRTPVRTAVRAVAAPVVAALSPRVPATQEYADMYWHLVRGHGYSPEYLFNLDIVQLSALHAKHHNGRDPGVVYGDSGLIAPTVPAAPVAQPVYQFQAAPSGGCPGGVCPTPQSSGRRRLFDW